MIYQQEEPSPDLSSIIKSFWLIDSQGVTTIQTQKIIPDGYPEIIFHYQEPYLANFGEEWVTQTHDILAGQLRNFFFLKNTGASGMFAIKFQPWALKTLFGIDMDELVDKANSLDSRLLALFQPLKNIAISDALFLDKVKETENWLRQFLPQKESSKGELACQLIIRENGLISIQEVLQKIQISERSLERYFKKHIGLSPKFYSRIIRLSYIFRLVEHDKANWADISFLGGFYDQSHFIKNFKEFTGDEPSKYGFSEENMANFFLRE